MIKPKTKKPPKPKEKQVHQMVCDYINMQYPNVIFTSDASGMRCTMGLRMELKRKRCKKYKIPDLIILHPNKGYAGLILEIKRHESEWYTKDGVIKINDDHVHEQWQALARLNDVGYAAHVACGFDRAKKLIDDYLKAA